ncbi:MAG: beta-N-acetylhexosaminidase [Syntrophobacteraceae bacterium]
MDDPGIHIFAGFRGTGLEQELKHILQEFRPAGIVLFKRNIEGADQLKDLVTEAQARARERLGRPLLWAIDQEGGTVQRLAPHFTHLPAAKTIAADVGDVCDWAFKAATDLREIGIQINFAPVLDIVSEKTGHFMESRSLGSDPKKVAALGKAWITALQDSGISATAKHFPGLGRAELDPHHFSPLIKNDDIESFRKDLVPFKAAIEAGVHCVMTSHAIYPAIDSQHPATLSYEINHRYLREQLGFTGTLFSDDLDMAAISDNYSPESISERGLACGTDFFLLCQKIENIEYFYSSIAHLIDREPLIRARHTESLARIEKLMRFHFPSSPR